jgi:hypothetical protein
LPTTNAGRNAQAMFTFTEAEVASIQAAYHAGGEQTAADEMPRLFPAFADRADATSFAVGIAC